MSILRIPIVTVLLISAPTFGQPKAQASPEGKAPQPTTQVKETNPVSATSEALPPEPKQAGPETLGSPSTQILDDESEPAEFDTESLVEQVGRMLLSLLFVVALIYFIGKVGLSRLTGLRTGVSNGSMEVIERMTLDQKHALCIVSVDQEHRLLIGIGEGKVQLVKDLSPVRAKFSDHLKDKTAPEDVNVSEAESNQ